MFASEKPLMAETNSSAGSSSLNRFIMSQNQSSKKIQINFEGSNNEINPLPAASPSSCSLHKLSSVCCSKLELVSKSEEKKYCMACIGKWVSDVSEMENVNVCNLFTYLRTEFQSIHFTKTEEKLRVLEEESVLEARENKNLEAELRVVKDKCSELSLKLWNSESSKTDMEIDLKNCELECREMREKVGKLEKVVRNKDKELAELKMRYRDLECSKKQGKEVPLGLELEPDVSLNQYLRKVKSASKMKSKALVEIEASDSQGLRKRRRKSLDGKNNTKDQASDELVNVKPKEYTDRVEGLAEMAAMSEILEEKTKKKKKISDSEASGKHGLEANEGAVGEAVEENVVHLDAPCNEKSSCELLGAKVDKCLPSSKVYPPGCASCHQCKRADRGKIITCTKCKRRYCLLCIQKRYPQLSHGEIEKSCPACQGFCDCRACLRKSGKVEVKLVPEQHGT